MKAKGNGLKSKTLKHLGFFLLAIAFVAQFSESARANDDTIPEAATSIYPGVSDFYPRDEDSEREDKLTGGIERAPLVAGNSDIRITVDVPAFLLTLWQGEREVMKFHVGVGLKDYPIVFGERLADQIILNPDWIPPDSDWVHESKIKPYVPITARDPRNPLGKIKIPLGGGYLLHQAKGAGDIGNLVSRGCVRIPVNDLFNLSKAIARAYDLPVKNIDLARGDKKQRFIKLEEPLTVHIYYDTMVVENGVLHIYPDVYDFKRNTVERLRRQLDDYGIGRETINDATLEKMLARVKPKQQFVVALADISAGNALTKGKLLPVVGSPAVKAAPKRRR